MQWESPALSLQKATSLKDPIAHLCTDLYYNFYSFSDLRQLYHYCALTQSNISTLKKATLLCFVEVCPCIIKVVSNNVQNQQNPTFYSH